jgi:hypothetical protein
MAGRRTRPRLRAAFATPELRRCQLAVGTAQVVEVALLVAVSVHLFDRSGATVVAAVGVVITVAPAIATPLLTAAVSRTSPGRGLAACLAVASVGVGSTTALVVSDGPIGLVLLTAATTGVATGSVRAIVGSLLPSLLRDPAALVATNTAASMIENLGTVAGPMLAGVAIATVGPVPLLWVLTGVVATVTVTVGTMPAPTVVRRPASNLLAGVGEGVRVLLGTPPARLVTLLVASQTVVRGAVNVLVVVLSIERLGVGEGGVGLLLGMIGVGGLIGLPIGARAVGAGRRGRTLAVALLLWGVPLIGVGVVTTDVVVVALFTVVGVGNTLVDISSDTVLQRALPAGSLPRALGVHEALLLAGRATGAALAGPLLLVVDVEVAFVVVGALLPVVVAVAGRALGRLDETMRTRDAGVALLPLNANFSPLVLSTVDQLARTARTIAYAPGEEIIIEGAAGHDVHVIESGEAEVRRGAASVAVLGPGEVFGEMALLDDAPRNATVVARTDVVTRSLGREDFLRTLSADEDARTAASRLAEERRGG